jgi:hypothetical protein
MDKYCGCRVADILDIAPCPPSSLTYNEFRNYALSQNISDAEIKRIASNCQISGSPTPRPPPFPVEYLEGESYVKILIIVVVVVAVVLIAAVVVILYVLQTLSLFRLYVLIAFKIDHLLYYTDHIFNILSP